MFNYELKTKISNRTEIIKRIKNLGAVYEGTMNHADYYFKTGTDKEKIRKINNKTLFLISYKRSEKEGRKDSNYVIKKLSAKEKKVLLKQNPVLCIVNKIRKLWVYKNTRIHLDKINNLGNFLELETVVKDISKKQGLNEFNEVASLLKIDFKRTEPFSYSDLILNRNRESQSPII